MVVASILFAGVVAVGGQTAASAAPTGWTSQNTSFVTRNASQLELNGARLRASGANIYWLGLDENVGGVDYPTYFRIKDTLDAAHRAGITVVRSHMATSTSQNDANSLALMPSIGKYNEQAFATMDFAVAYAGKLGIRLILPLTDEWAYYHGGHRDFTAPFGLQPDDFYTDPRAIGAYQDYVDHVIHHVNTLTGVPYSQDPTIMAWELGNELEGMTLPWINAQVAHIKQEAPQQLVAAGRRFDIDPDTLAAPNLDIVDVHYYPPTATKISSDAKAVTAAGKAYIAGEYASTSATSDLLSAAAADPNVSGMFVWSLFGHDDRSGLVAHDDGFTLHIPGGTASEQARADAIEGYSRALGVTIPKLPLEPPLITAVTRTHGIATITWRGTAGATGYVVDRQTNGGTWTPVHTGTLGAAAGSVTDFASPTNASYRVSAVGASGTAGATSDVVAPENGEILVDPVKNWRLSTAHTNMAVRADPAGGYAATANGGTGSISWQQAGLTQATFRSNEPAALSVETSQDAASWTPATAVTRSDGLLTASSLHGDYIRVVVTGTAQLTRATLRSAAADPTTPPGNFTLQTPTDGIRDVTATPTFTWMAAPDAAYYQFTVTDQHGTVIARSDGLTTTTVRPDVDLKPNQIYFWSVSAVNGAGSTSSAPTTASFSTRALPTEPLVVENFEQYADDGALNAAYVRNTGGGAITGTLIPNPSTASHAGHFAYDLSGPGYAGVVRTLDPAQDWWGYSGVQLSLAATVGHTVTLQIVANGSYFEANVPVNGSGWQRISVPFDRFKPPAWAPDAAFDPSKVTQLAFYLGGEGTGALTVDDITTVVTPTAIQPSGPGGTGATPTPTPTAAGPSPKSGGGTAAGTASHPNNTVGHGSARGLAFTGWSIGPAAPIAALIAILLGSALVVVARRRRTARSAASNERCD